MQGNGPDLDEYALELIGDIRGVPTTRTWTSKDLAELGGYQLRRSDGFDVVGGTITDDLDPSTSYAARLRVRDVRGKTFTTAIARASTDAQRQLHVDVFTTGALPSGAFLLPESEDFTLRATGGVRGGPSLRYKLLAAMRPEFENLRISGMNLAFDDTLTEKLLSSAYLEFWIKGRGSPASAWSDVWIRLNPTTTSLCADPNDCIWSYSGKWVYRPDPQSPIYRRVQIPLSALRHRNGDGAPLEPLAGGRTLREVSVGVPYFDAADEVDIDQVGVFW
jgi:hypothetical protein